MPGTGWEDPAPLIKKLLASYPRTLGNQGHPLEEFRYVHTACAARLGQAASGTVIVTLSRPLTWAKTVIWAVWPVVH